MDSNLQTSFIPKKPLVPGGNSAKPQHSTNVFSVVTYVLFITVALVSVGVFGYKMYLNSSITNANSELDQTLASFDPKLIDDLGRLDDRLDSARVLMNQHVALSTFFTHIANNTLENVQFTSFNYSNKEKGTTVTLAGVSKSFAAVASQAEYMMSDDNKKFIQNPVFSNFNLDQNGNVVFSVTGSVVPSAFYYKNTIPDPEPQQVEADITSGPSSETIINN